MLICLFVNKEYCFIIIHFHCHLQATCILDRVCSVWRGRGWFFFFFFGGCRLTAKPRDLLLLHRGKKKSHTVTALPFLSFLYKTGQYIKQSCLFRSLGLTCSIHIDSSIVFVNILQFQVLAMWTSKLWRTEIYLVWLKRYIFVFQKWTKVYKGFEQHESE